MRKYDHRKIEQKWQKYWAAKKLYRTANVVKGKENYFLLTEFPYPSGNLHVGHWYAFSVPDILARYLSMTGKNVMYPIGFDAFGLPAENAAIKNKLNPRKWTEKNIAYMSKQLKSMGTSFDWSREVRTIDPEYYKWTQWQFLQFFKNGLAYRKNTPANWCPSCKTVLANEQVVNGKCERCGTEVIQKEMMQWNLRITKYADRLVDDLDALNWPEQIKESQRNWIGRSEGAKIHFELIFETPKFNENGGVRGEKAHIAVFTTRPDTLFGATYMVLSPEHPMVAKVCASQTCTNRQQVEEYVKAANKKTELERQENREKTGVRLEGVEAVNPANGERIPLFIADYVLAHYGTGAIMAVPAHDERDFHFAKQFGVEIREVVSQLRGDTAKLPFAGDGTLVNSGEYTGMKASDALPKMAESFGTRTRTYKLRDWIVSRQRYWGVPIPIIHCARCALRDPSGQGEVAVPDKDLPVKLPEVKDYLPEGSGKSPLAKVKKWVNVKCPKCKGKAERETDTFDTFIDSSWYFQRYTDPKNKRAFADSKKLENWLPVDLYSGGAEHTTMHLLYSRFWHKAMYDLGLVKESEPYARRMNRSLIMGPDGQKMSKSKGNVVGPDEVVARLGADTVRMYLAFIGPYNEVSNYPWNPDGVVGVRRFIERVWKLAQKAESGKQKVEQNVEVERVLHLTIKKLTEDIPALKFNTAISQMMIFMNEAEKNGVTKSQYEMLLVLLAPFAPHVADELWSLCGHKKSIHHEKWPVCDEKTLVASTVTIAVQVNGKTRGTITMPADADEKSVQRAAELEKTVIKHLAEHRIARVIYVKNRLLNFVLATS